MVDIEVVVGTEAGHRVAGTGARFAEHRVADHMLSGMVVVAGDTVPVMFFCPQLVQKALTGAALAACRFCPQLLQKALLAGTSAWQAGQWRVKGCAGVAETATVCSAEPQ